MRLEYQCIESWPPLAWLAIWSTHSDVVEIRHGKQVETHEEWFGEIVWDSDFRRANFDETDIAYGSGARLRNGEVRFVSSSSVLDRLHTLVGQEVKYVSNSLACLLAATGAELDPGYANYYRDFQTIIRGLANYCRAISTSQGDIELLYYDHLLATSGSLVECPKPRLVRNFSSFGHYRGFLEESICRLAENAACTNRIHAYDLIATVSTGYDSPTVAALARPAGLRQTLSFDRARNGLSDSGEEIARRLGLQSTVIDREAWRDRELPEVSFLASDAKGEDVYFSGAENALAGRLVLTGFGANRVWKQGNNANDDFRRGDQSGLSLAEYRLWCGFQHCPVPSIGSRQTADLYALLGSPDMARWNNGTSYSKPFCRRVLQEAGVPGETFGMKKKAASVLLFDRESFLTPISQESYCQWRNRALQSGHFGATFRFKDTLNCLLASLGHRVVRPLQSFSSALAEVIPFTLLKRIGQSERLTNIARYETNFRHLFPWAVEHAIARHRNNGESMPRLGSPQGIVVDDLIR